MDLTWIAFIQAALAAALAGFSKTGVPGLGILIVPLLAGVLGARGANGVLLPMLLFADFFAVGYYRQHADWKILLRLMPWVLCGLGAGYFALKMLGDSDLNIVFGVLILGLVLFQVVKNSLGGRLETHMPRTWWFAAVMGFLAGFTTMVGNLAGSITGLYLISMGVEKQGFMGTSAWFYLTVNAIKVPFYIDLGLITRDRLVLDAELVVFILIGVAAGLFAFKRIPQKWFDRAVLLLATAAGVKLILQTLMRAG
jgi:hypothetical protein